MQSEDGDDGKEGADEPGADAAIPAIDLTDVQMARLAAVLETRRDFDIRQHKPARIKRRVRPTGRRS